MAQNEGKHMGSVQDAQRSGEPLHKRAVVNSSTYPQPNDQGGDYGVGWYSDETGMYLNKEWQPGYAMLKDGEKLDHIMLRYDVYHQQMQFVKDKDTLAFADPEELDYIFFDSKRFVYQPFERNGALMNGYFEVLKDGDCKLLLCRTITHHINNDGISGEEGDQYLRDVSYYVVKEGETEAHEMRACKKGVLCAFKDHKDEVRDYMKNNNLKMKTCEDLVEVVSFYNSLD